MTQGTSSEQILISLPQGSSIRNINAIWPVVHEKKHFEVLSIFFILP